MNSSKNTILAKDIFYKHCGIIIGEISNVELEIYTESMNDFASIKMKEMLDSLYKKLERKFASHQEWWNIRMCLDEAFNEKIKEFKK